MFSDPRRLMAPRDESEDESDAESICSTLSEASSTGAEPSCKVYFGSKPYFTGKYIREHFAKHGFDESVSKVTMFYHSDNHKPKGCGYVTFTSTKHAQEAIQKLNGTTLLGDHRLVLRPYKRKRKHSVKKTTTRPSSPCKGKKQPKAPLTRRGSPFHVPTPMPQNPTNPSCSWKDKTVQEKAQAAGVCTSKVVLVSEFSDSSSASRDFCKVKVDPNLHGVMKSENLQPNKKSSDHAQEVTMGATGPSLLLQEIVPQFSDTIQLKNLHPLIGEKKIRAMIRVPIVSCMFQKTGPSSNQVTLKLSSPYDAHAAITSIDGKKLNGQVVSATLLHPTSLNPTPLEAESKPLTSSCTQAAILPSPLSASNEIVKVKVTNLPQKIHRQQLQKVFERHGRICNVELFDNPPYAFVNFYTLKEAEATCGKLQNTVLRGRQLNIQVQYPAGFVSPAAPVQSVGVQYPTQPDEKAKATTLYFCIPDHAITEKIFHEYLTKQLRSKVGGFCINEFKKQKDGFTCQVQFPSFKKAKKALKILNTSSKDFSVSLTKHSTVSLVSEIENFRGSIEMKRTQFLAQHKEKLEQLIVKQKSLQLPKSCPLHTYEKLKGQRAVVQQQLEECQLQENEFLEYCKTLLEDLKHLESSAPVTRKPLEERVSTMRKGFGRECGRFLKALPIYAKRREIVETVQANQVTILVGETGSGKSTQIVQYLYDAGFAEPGLIACTQPRKVAATTLAAHVSIEMGVKLGTVLGYKVGMSGKYSKHTKVLYLTDHALLNEFIADQELSKYSCIIIDEAHERSLHTDLLLSFIKKLLPRRQDLRVVITSATIDPALFNRYFGGNCPIVKVSGRTFPVDVIWSAHVDPQSSATADVPTSPITMDYISEAINVTHQIHRDENEGDILIFLTSPAETERACQILSGKVDDRAVVLPLHGKLQPQEQQKVFHTFEGKRKIIFATNVAETSVTIPGVKYIVDSGLAKELCFYPKRSMNSLEVRIISKSSAEQRKGRAGRTSEGKCYRLYSQDLYNDTMPDRMLPEILRVQLAHAILKLYEFGITDILAFDFVEQPDPVALTAAVETLKFLGAVKEGQLADLGKKIAVLPLDPQLAKVLLDGVDAGIGLEAAVAVTISSLAGNVFFRGGSDEMKSESDKKKTQFCHPAGDQMTYLSAYQNWVQQKKDQRTKWCVDNYINAKSMRIVEETLKELRDTLSRHLSIQLPPRVANLENAEDKLPKLYFDTFIRNIGIFLGHERVGYMTESMPGEPLVIFPGSALRQLNLIPKCVVYEKTLKTTQHFLLQVVPVREEWIQEAIDSGKLACHPPESLSKFMVSPASITNIGQYVFRRVTNKNTLPEIKKQLQQVCGETPYTLQHEYDKGVITVFSHSSYHAQILQVIDGHLSYVRENLKKEQHEVGLTKQDDDVKLLMGLGGSVQHVLMPYHYRTVVVKGPPDGDWLGATMTSLSQYGEIEKEYSKIGKQNCRLFATFYNPDNAVNAVRLLKFPEGIFIEQHNRGEAGAKFTLKIEWCRRQRKNFAFIDFNHPEDLEIAKGSLLHYPLVVFGSYLKIHPSKYEDKIQLFVTNVGQQVTEQALKAAVESRVPDVNFTVRLGFEKSFETTPEQLDAIKKHLEGLIENFATQGKYSLEVHPPMNYYKTFRATASFQDPDEGQQNLDGLRLNEIGGKPLDVKLALVSSVRYIPAVYEVIKDAVEELKAELQNRYGTSVKITEKQDKWRNTIIQIMSDDVQTFAVAKNVLNTVIQPDVTECRSQILRQFLFAHNCHQELDEIQSSTSTYIFADRRTMTIKIYGTEANVTRAKVELNGKLCKLEGHESQCYPLKAPEKPPGLMKHLINVFGLDLQGLTSREGITTAVLDPRRHTLTVFATSEAHTYINQVIKSYADGDKMPNREEDQVECCVCFTPVDNLQSIFRLEYCGHAYCLDCIQLQVAPNAVTFPLQCAECSHPFVWQDCVNLFQRTNITCQQLAATSVKSYMMANKHAVRSCPTPNCDMVYVVSDDGKRFICSHCGIHLCTKCHDQYHDGLTCAMYQAGKHGEKEFEEWLRENPRMRKRCPKCTAPIEKIDGCNNVYCEHCHTSICWMCLAYFDSSQKCYAHLHQSHGGFV